MKRLIVLIALVVLPVSMLFAHPASELTVSYPARQFILTITGKHMVSTSENKDTKQHFIKAINVTVNGKIANNSYGPSTFTSQTGDTFKTAFKLDLKNGDKIVVTAICSLGGEKTTEIVVAGRRR